MTIASHFSSHERIVVYPGDCLNFLKTIPANTLQLIVTSPPYNIGKEYEKKLDLRTYLAQQAAVIQECARALSDHAPWASPCDEQFRLLENCTP